METGIPYVYTQAEHIKLQECDDALFGSWDMSLRERVPGLVEKLNNLSLMIKVIGAFATFSFIHDLGVPTEVVFPLLGKLLASIVGS